MRPRSCLSIMLEFSIENKIVFAHEVFVAIAADLTYVEAICARAMTGIRWEVPGICDSLLAYSRKENCIGRLGQIDTLLQFSKETGCA